MGAGAMCTESGEKLSKHFMLNVSSDHYLAWPLCLQGAVYGPVAIAAGLFNCAIHHKEQSFGHSSAKSSSPLTHARSASSSSGHTQLLWQVWMYAKMTDTLQAPPPANTSYNCHAYAGIRLLLQPFFPSPLQVVLLVNPLANTANMQ